MQSSILLELNVKKRINDQPVTITDKQINTAFRRSQSIERLINQSSLKIKPEVINCLHELRHIIQLQSLALSGQVY